MELTPYRSDESQELVTTPQQNPITKKERMAARAYRAHYADLARNYRLLDATDHEIAGFLGVDVATLRVWEDLYPDFAVKLAQGGSQANASVAAKLYEKAMGAKRVVTKHFTVRDSDGNTDIVEKKFIEEEFPNQQAIEFFLTNRAPDKWKKTQHIETRGVQYIVQLNDADSKV
jgi:hypothetical protein